MRLEEGVPLAPMTTLGIGGPARYFARAASVDDLTEAFRWAGERQQRVLILGGGSNVLIPDEGFDGLVIRIELRGITIDDENEFVHVAVGAGEPWDEFVETAVTRRWAGIECLSGIPGLAGATPIQNVGAYGQEVSETIVRVHVFDRHEGSVRILTRAECEFGYRSSLFKSDRGRHYVVLGVTYRLTIGGQAAIRYPELRTYLEERGIAADDLAGVREAVIAIRRRKGMVLDPEDPDTRSDGSFFMNPVVSSAKAAALAGAHPAMPAFPSETGVKLSAAWLIERAGFHKGLVHGNVGLSSKHTLAIINRGGGTAREVRELVAIIQDRVREVFGIELQPEPNVVR